MRSDATHGRIGRASWLAASVVAFSALSAQAQAKADAKAPPAAAQVTADAGKAEVDGVKGVSLFGEKPAIVKLSGPGVLSVRLRAKTGSKQATRFTISAGGKVVETGNLEAAKDPKALAPEKAIDVTVAEGALEVAIAGAKGSDGYVRIVAFEAARPAPAPLPDLDIPDAPPARPDTLEIPSSPSAPAPVAAPAAPVVATEPSADTQWRVSVRPFASAGMVRETGFSSPLLPGLGAPGPVFQVGAFVHARRGPLQLTGELRDGFYQRSYALRWSGVDGKLPVIAQDEQNVALGFNVGWEVLHHLAPALSQKLAVSPFAGPAARLLVNDAAPQQVVGVELGARLDWQASESVAIRGSAAWLGHWSFIPALDYQGVPLLLGAPRSATDLRLQALVQLNGPARLVVAWENEIMVLQLAYRSYQTLSAGLDYAF